MGKSIKVLLSFILVLSIFGTFTPQDASATSDFIWPLKSQGDKEVVVTSNFGWRSYDNKFHNGIDIDLNSNSREYLHNVYVYAVADGVVSRSYVSSSYGETIFIKHTINGKAYESVYAHLEENSRKFSVNDKVKQGDIIGIMGTTPNVAQHLHFELYSPYWEPVVDSQKQKRYALNPKDYLGSIGAPVIDKDLVTFSSFENPGDPFNTNNEKFIYYEATVANPKYGIFDGPGSGYNYISSSNAYKDQKVIVTKESQQDGGALWAKITDSNGKYIGWITKDHLSFVKTIEKYKIATVENPKYGIYDGPGSGYTYLSSSNAYKGNIVVVKEESQNNGSSLWAKIEDINGKYIGWITKDHLELEDSRVWYPAVVAFPKWGIYRGPFTDAGYVTNSVQYQDELVVVRNESGTWAEMMLDGEVKGWITKSHLDYINYEFAYLNGAAQAYQYSDKSKKTYIIPDGKKVAHIRQEGSWHLIVDNNQFHWIKAK